MLFCLLVYNIKSLYVIIRKYLLYIICIIYVTFQKAQFLKIKAYKEFDSVQYSLKKNA